MAEGTGYFNNMDVVTVVITASMGLVVFKSDASYLTSG